MSGNELTVPVASVVRSPLSTRLSPDREADGLEQPQEMAKASAEDLISGLRRQLEEQQVVNASFEERLGRLESAGKAAAVADIIDMFPPDAHEAMGDQPEAAADANAGAIADSIVGGAEIAEPVQTCDLAESMWDSPLVLGRRELGMGRVVSLWAVLVLLLDIILQTTIAAIVVSSMGDPTFAVRVIEDLRYASQPRFASARSMNM